MGSSAPTLSHGLVFPPPRTISFIVLFSQYLKNVPVPLPSYQRGKKCHLYPVYLFQIFPVCWGSRRPNHGHGHGRGTGLTTLGCTCHSCLATLVLPSPACMAGGRGRGGRGKKDLNVPACGEGRRVGHQDLQPSLCLHLTFRLKGQAGRHPVPHNSARCGHDLTGPHCCM